MKKNILSAYFTKLSRKTEDVAYASAVGLMSGGFMQYALGNGMVSLIIGGVVAGYAFRYGARQLYNNALGPSIT